MILVEGCKNWVEYYLGTGHHCWNCVNRDGYPYRGQPSKACKNYRPKKVVDPRPDPLEQSRETRNREERP
jgi:hypothetical protein